jgi:uncharacterized protein
MLRAQRAGIPVCVTVSHVDGLVLARSAFRHSLNYRAVMAFGTAVPVEDEVEKEAGLNAFIDLARDVVMTSWRLVGAPSGAFRARR